MKQPIQLAIEETKNNIINFINEECKKNGIDYYFLYLILKEIYEETSLNKEKELEEMKKELLKGENENGIHEN